MVQKLKRPGRLQLFQVVGIDRYPVLSQTPEQAARLDAAAQLPDQRGAVTPGQIDRHGGGLDEAEALCGGGKGENAAVHIGGKSF